jgi:hypothetical protein
MQRYGFSLGDYLIYICVCVYVCMYVCMYIYIALSGGIILEEGVDLSSDRLLMMMIYIYLFLENLWTT